MNINSQPSEQSLVTNVNNSRFKLMLKISRKCLDDLEEQVNKAGFNKLMDFDDVAACIVDELYDRLRKAQKQYKLSKPKKNI